MFNGKILIVEDEESVIQPLQIFMEKRGFQMLYAKNGQEGLSLALAEKPDIIITDVLMPVMDGIEMLRELRKDEWGKTAKVLVLTNHPTQATKTGEQGVTWEFRMTKSDVTMADIAKKIDEIASLKG